MVRLTAGWPVLPLLSMVRLVRGRGLMRANAAATSPVGEGLLGAPARPAVDAAPVPIAPGRSAGGLPRAVLAQVGAAAPAPFERAALAAVAAQAAHAAPRPAEHGPLVSEFPRQRLVAAVAAAGDGTPVDRVEGREGDALASVLALDEAVGCAVGLAVRAGCAGWLASAGVEGRQDMGARSAAVAAGRDALGRGVGGGGAVLAGVCCSLAVFAVLVLADAVLTVAVIATVWSEGELGVIHLSKPALLGLRRDDGHFFISGIETISRDIPVKHFVDAGAAEAASS